jgi:hypothetical protein
LADLFGGHRQEGNAGIAGTLNRLTSTTLLAMSNFNEALGEKSKAEVLKQEAQCAESGTCAHGISITLEIMQEASEDLRKRTADLRANQVRLEKKEAQKALDGIVPAIKALPLWAQVTLQTKAVVRNMD